MHVNGRESLWCKRTDVRKWETFCATYRLFKQFLFGIVLVGDLWNHTIWDMIEYDSTADNLGVFSNKNMPF